MVLPRKALLSNPAAKAPRAFGAIDFFDGAGKMGFHMAVEVEGAGELTRASRVDADIWGWLLGSGGEGVRKGPCSDEEMNGME